MEIYYSYIIIGSKQNSKDAVFIRNANKLKDVLLGLKKDNILNIKGLGRLKIKDISRNVYDDDFKSVLDDTENKYYEIGLICEKVSDHWSENTSTMVKYLTDEARVRRVLEDDALKTWGDEYGEALSNVHEWFGTYD